MPKYKKKANNKFTGTELVVIHLIDPIESACGAPITRRN